MFASRSGANESLELEVVNVDNALKSGNPVRKLLAIANLETKSLSGKFVHVSSETLGQNVSFLARGGCKLHGDILVFD